MRLVNYGLGEITDRLSILSLKKLFGEQAGRDTTHWRNEQNALLVQARNRSLNLELALELAAVNAALWHKEDELRAYRQQPIDQRAQWAGFGKSWVEAVAAVAILIQELNDKRAAIIQKINEAAGDASAPEKL